MDKSIEYWIAFVNSKYSTYEIYEKTYEQLKHLTKLQDALHTQTREGSHDMKYAKELAEKLYITGSSLTPIIVVIDENGAHVLIEGRHRCEALKYIHNNPLDFKDGHEITLKVIEIPIADFNNDLDVARKWAIQHQASKPLIKAYTKNDIKIEIARDFKANIDVTSEAYKQQLKTLFNLGNLRVINDAIKNIKAISKPLYQYDQETLQLETLKYDCAVFSSSTSNNLYKQLASLLLKMQLTNKTTGTLIVHHKTYKDIANYPEYKNNLQKICDTLDDKYTINIVELTNESSD